MWVNIFWITLADIMDIVSPEDMPRAKEPHTVSIEAAHSRMIRTTRAFNCHYVV